MTPAEAETSLRAYAKTGEGRITAGTVAALFGCEKAKEALLWARDAITNPVVSRAERDRLHALVVLALRAAIRQCGGFVNHMVLFLGLTRPTYYRLVEAVGIDEHPTP